jgi:hypothetical protein
MCVLMGQILLCGLLSGGLQDDVGSQTRTSGCVTRQDTHFSINLPDRPAETPDRPQSLSSGTGERRAGTDESFCTRLRRDLGTCRLLVVQSVVGSLMMPASARPAMGIVARGIRLQVAHKI